MSEKKFVKAVCTTRDRHFGLEVEKFGSVYEVTNFIDISKEEASLLPTQVRQDRFYVHSNLQGCYEDRSRLVAGSSAPYGKPNCIRKCYNYDCLFCNKLSIDYSSAKISGQYRKGDVIRLSQGQEVPIEFEDERPLDHILIGAGWDPVQDDNNMDVDCSVILCGQGASNLVYFAAKTHPSGAVIHHGDNLTGNDEDTASEDDENIDIYLKKVPVSFDRLVFVFNVYSGQPLTEVQNMYFNIMDPNNQKTMIEYRIAQPDRGDNAVIVAVLKRTGSGWSIKAVGESLYVESIHALERIVAARHY